MERQFISRERTAQSADRSSQQFPQDKQFGYSRDQDQSRSQKPLYTSSYNKAIRQIEVLGKTGYDKGRMGEGTSDSSYMRAIRQIEMGKTGYDKGRMGEGTSELSLVKDHEKQKGEKDVIEKSLEKMQSDQQVYEHHQLMLDAYLHYQPNGLSRKEINSMACDLRASTLAMAVNAVQACKQKNNISSFFIEKIGESEKECREVFQELDPFNDKQG